MFETLELINFQRHKHFKITFHPLITSIIGPTDSGKTALLRALRLLCLNKPKGTSFIHHDAEQCKIKLKVDGHVIIRKRGKHSNSYIVNKERFKPFGVPDAVSSILNIDEINISRQLDPHFLFMATPGEVSKSLNQIINLDVIDTILARAASSLRKAKSASVATLDRITDAKRKKEDLAWVKEAKKAIERIEHIKQANITNRLQCLTIASILKTGQEHHLTHQNASKAAVGVANLIAIGERVLENTRSITSLANLLGSISKSYAASVQIIPNLDGLDAITSRAGSLQKDINNLKSLIGELESEEDFVMHADQQLISAEERIHEVGECPLCGNSI